MKALLDKDGLDRRPHVIGDNCYYYETRKGLEIYLDGKKNRNYIEIQYSGVFKSY